jgi:hypothetical protein
LFMQPAEKCLKAQEEQVYCPALIRASYNSYGSS